MLHSRDHDRRRRTASSSDDDDDDDNVAYEDPGVHDEAARQADVALARLAEHVFRRRRPMPSPGSADESASLSSGEDEVVDGEPDDDLPAETVGVAIVVSPEQEEVDEIRPDPTRDDNDVDDGKRKSAAPTDIAQVAETPNDAAADEGAYDNIVAEHTTAVDTSTPMGGGEQQQDEAEPRPARRREFVEPPIPEGRKYRFYMHDSRADDDDDNGSAATAGGTAAPAPARSRADREWKHDLFHQLLEEPRYPRRRPGDRPRQRWAPKGSNGAGNGRTGQQKSLPPSVAATVPEWTQPGSDWKPDGYDAHARNVKAAASARPAKRWVPKTAEATATTASTASADKPEPVESDLQQPSWSVPEPVEASDADEIAAPSDNDARQEETQQVEPEPKPPSAPTPKKTAAAAPSPGLNPEAPAVTVMNPEALEFQLPSTMRTADEEELMYPAASVDYCWVYDDGAVMPAPGPVFDYVYDVADVDVQPYYFYADPYGPSAAPAPVAVIDEARNATTTTTSSTSE